MCDGAFIEDRVGCPRRSSEHSRPRARPRSFGVAARGHASHAAGMSNEAHLVAFENQASQAPCGVGASVDIDAVRFNIGLHGRGVAMHDDLAEILLVQEKIFSDPEQVCLTLLFQRNSRPHARMREKEVPARERQCETFKEAAMVIGQRLSEGNG